MSPVTAEPEIFTPAGKTPPKICEGGTWMHLSRRAGHWRGNGRPMTVGFVVLAAMASICVLNGPSSRAPHMTSATATAMARRTMLRLDANILMGAHTIPMRLKYYRKNLDLYIGGFGTCEALVTVLAPCSA